MFVLKTEDGKILPNTPYKLTLGDGRAIQGVTDRDGRAMRAGSGSTSKAIKIELA
jgi:uncharacterized protein (DUF2345 family)